METIVNMINVKNQLHIINLPDDRFNSLNTSNKQKCLSPRCNKSYSDSSENGHISRLVEAKNFLGAAEALRDLNPFSEVATYLSDSDDFDESPNDSNIPPRLFFFKHILIS